MSRDIFISYSHADQTIANKVCQRLEEAGFSCWISSRDELPGEQWAEMIARGVDESKIVLFILSNHSNNSPACVKELALAHDKDKIIIPLRVEEVILSQKLEFFLVGQQRIDALTAPIEKRSVIMKPPTTLIMAAVTATRPKAATTSTKQEEEIPHLWGGLCSSANLDCRCNIYHFSAATAARPSARYVCELRKSFNRTERPNHCVERILACTK